MKTRNLMIEASVSALILASLSMATPAWAQDAGATSSDNATADKPAKAKDESDDVATDIIITARRKALADAISIKKNSDTIVDSVTADEAGKLPDNSITEVLQRVPGVSISRFTGVNGGNTAFQIEGSGITVRGLPFNSSRCLQGDACRPHRRGRLRDRSAHTCAVRFQGYAVQRHRGRQLRHPGEKGVPPHFRYVLQAVRHRYRRNWHIVGCRLQPPVSAEQRSGGWRDVRPIYADRYA